MESVELVYELDEDEEEEDTVPQLLACRVCLETDLKLYDLHRNGLADVFAELTGIQVSKTDGLPQYLCIMCNELLRKSSVFRARCRRANVLLQNARMRQPWLTTTYIKSLDRMHLKYSFTLTNALNLHFPSEAEILEHTKEKKEIIEEEKDEEELDIEIPCFNYEQNPLVKAEPLQINMDEMSNDWNNDSEDMQYEKISTINIQEIIKKDGDQTEDFDIVKIPEKNEEVKCEKISPININKIIKKDSDIIVKNQEENEEQKTDKTLLFKMLTTTEKKPETKSKTRKKVTPKRKLEVDKPEKKVPEKKKKRPCNMKYIEDYTDFCEELKCVAVFQTKEQQKKEVEERKDSYVFKKSRFKCNICYIGVMNISAYNKHMALHDESSGDHLCDVCHTRWRTRDQWLSHVRRHKYRFVCKICDHVSKGSENAKLHHRWHEGVKYKCQDCNKESKTYSTHLNHRRTYHTKSTCSICKAEVSGGTKGLDEHKENAHSTEKFPCVVCRMKLESQEAFDRHLNAEGVCDQRLVPCTKCGETFQNKHHLFDHRETVHNETWYRCGQCPEAYTSGRMLAMHWTNKHPNAPLVCEVCGKTFKGVGSLQTHQRSKHAGHVAAQSKPKRERYRDPKKAEQQEKPRGPRKVQCTMCPKSFASRFHMEMHRNTHTGERPFPCPQCDSRFRAPANRDAHILRMHLKERRFKCEYCEKAFFTPADLRLHVRAIHMKLPSLRNRRKKQ